MVADALTYWDIKTRIKASKIDPVYIFSGEEIFLKRFILEEIRLKLFPNDLLPFNYSVFFAKESSCKEVLDTVKTQPFMSAKRLIVLKNVEKFSEREKELLAFLSKPAAKSVFIMETEKKSSDKFIKKLTAFATTVNFDKLEGDELMGWVVQYIKSHGKMITPTAALLLIEKLGNDLDMLVNAISKLLLYVGDADQISEKDIEIMIKRTREDTRFVFLNALMSKQLSSALTMADLLSRDGKHATDIIGLINWQLKRVEKVKNLNEQGYTQADIVSMLKLSPFALKSINKQSGSFSKQALQTGFKFLLETDLAIKQGLKAPGVALETLIVRLCALK
ncbi:MAG: DNA polymerase III subunit delta [Candidatus Omnitrophica bacterium]|nr:DNA polymerase III subunit delta [Candidatus Omnitrophota bacterium]